MNEKQPHKNLDRFATKGESFLPAVEVCGLKKKLGVIDVLQHVDMKIEPGEARVILGRSGEGKSVLLKHLCGLFRADAGQVYIQGTEITQLPEHELYKACAKVGMLFQGAALFDSLTVEENVGFTLFEHSNKKRREIREIVARNLEMVRLKDIMHKMPSELSGGMRKRVGLARVITQEPDIILYDEPTTGLDPVTGDAINDLIIQLADELNVTSVIVTHDMASAYKIADKISMLLNGKIIFTGSVKETKETDNAYVRQFVNGLAHGPLTGDKLPAEEAAV